MHPLPLYAEQTMSCSATAFGSTISDVQRPGFECFKLLRVRSFHAPIHFGLPYIRIVELPGDAASLPFIHYKFLYHPLQILILKLFF
jgi:hypothetical protein